MILEVLILVGLIKLLIIIKDVSSRVPEYQDLILSDIIMIREELKSLNAKLEIKPAKPFNNQELGQIFSKILMKLIIFRRFSLTQLLKLIFKHRSRLTATFSANNGS